MSEPTGGAPAPTSADSGLPKPSISVRHLLDDPDLGLELTLLAGASGLDRLVVHTRIQKSGLALTGHFHGIVPTRIQILGQTELSYLDKLSPEQRKASLSGFFGLGLSCVILTQGSRAFASEGSGEGVLPVPELLDNAEATGTPLLLSPERSSVTITAVHGLLDDRLAPRVRLHGVLVDVFGVGLMLAGPSGIGKSECALDLIMRGHRLVADDVVECDYRPPGMIFGQAAELLRYHLEVRGLGVLNVKDLFGVTAIRERKRIDVVVKLAEWSRDTEYDRMGLDERFHDILAVRIPELVIPVRPGRDMASILEIAARNELLKNAGHHAAREFFSHLEASLMGKRDRPRSTSRPPSAVDEANTPAVRTRPPPAPPPPADPASSRAAPSRQRVPPRAMPRAPESSASIPKPRREG